MHVWRGNSELQRAVAEGRLACCSRRLLNAYLGLHRPLPAHCSS